MSKLGEKIIIALDFNSIQELLIFLDSLELVPYCCKVGLRLFTLAGPQIVKILQSRGINVFLDLKFFDIPNTVSDAIKSVVDLGVMMTTIHLLGGASMIEVARKAAGNSSILILGVTVLTSLSNDNLSSVGFTENADQLTHRLTKIALENELKGIVAHPLRILTIREKYGKDFSIVTPGIRPQSNSLHDHQGAMTPSEALQAGANWLVIGRPITHAKNPALAYHEILTNIERKSINHEFY